MVSMKLAILAVIFVNYWSASSKVNLNNYFDFQNLISHQSFKLCQRYVLLHDESSAGAQHVKNFAKIVSDKNWSLVISDLSKIYTLDQRFSTGGPRPTGGPRRVCEWAAR